MHETLDALMAELGKGFETPRTVSRAPIEPPRTAGEVMKPPSRELPRPIVAEPAPSPPPAAIEPAAPTAPAQAMEPHAPPGFEEPVAPRGAEVPLSASAPTPPAAGSTLGDSPRRRASDLDETIMVAHRSRPRPAVPPETPAASLPERASRERAEPRTGSEHAEGASAAASLPPVAPTAARPSAPRALVLALAAALIAVVALYALPPVIKVSMPDVPSPRLPRIELVREREPAGQPLPASGESRAPVPERPEPARVSPEPTAVGSDGARASSPPPATGRPVRKETASVSAPRRSPPAPARTDAPSGPTAPAAPPMSSPSRTVDDPPAAATTPASPSAAARPTASPAIDTEADWPLLCGEVLDERGQPVAGARVLLADLDLGARSDRRGRFCIAAPVGDRTISVSAQGFATLRQLVSLGRQGTELSLRLK